MAVALEGPGTVELARVGGSQRFGLTWHVREGAETQIELDLYANLRVPRFLPLEGVDNTVAKQLVAAARTALASGL